jgi:hypothetical protein
MVKPHEFNGKFQRSEILMSDLTLSIVITILQNLTYAIVFILSAGAAYLTLNQPRVRDWLRGAGVLVQVVLFLVLSTLLYQTATPILSDLFAFPRGLMDSSRTAGFVSSARCLSGVLVLGGLVFGSWRLAKSNKQGHDELQ